MPEDSYDDYIKESAKKYNVPEDWIKATIKTESRGNPNAFRYEPRKKAGSRGLMQLMPYTARDLGHTGEDDELFDPAKNIDFGTKKLGQLREKYGDDFAKVYSAYNSGSPEAYTKRADVKAHVNNALNNLYGTSDDSSGSDSSDKIEPPPLKNYKITDKASGETYSIAFHGTPSQDDIKKISDLRAKHKRQTEISEATERERPWTAKLADWMYAPSEAIAPKVLPPEEVEKLPTGERIKRLGQEVASGLLSPENIAVAAPALTGPLGLAASSIVGGGQMLMHAPETVKAAYEHPSLETVGRTGILGAGLLGAGLGVKGGMKGYGTPASEATIPKVTPPRAPISRQLESSNPIDAEFVDKFHGMPGREQAQITGNVPYTERGDVKAGASTLEELKVLPPAPTPRQLEGTISPIESPASSIEDQLGTRQITGTEPKQLEGLPRVQSPFEMPPSDLPEQKLLSSQDPKLLEAYYGGLSKKNTSTLLKQRDSAVGKQRTMIDQVLKRRGALPDENETMEIPELNVSSIEKIVAEKTKGQVKPEIKVNAPETEAPRFVERRKTGMTQGEIPLKNEWLRGQDDGVLQAMKDGASKEMQTEIDMVLRERGTLPERRGGLKQAEETPKVENPLESPKGKGVVEEEPPKATAETSTTEEEPKLELDEGLYNTYNQHLEDLVSQDNVESYHLRDIIDIGKRAGLDQDTITNDLIENTPRLTNNTKRIYAATDKVFSKGERGFGTIDFFIGKARKAAAGTEAEAPIEQASKELNMFQKSLPKPESVIGRMGESGLKLERMMEDAQYSADSTKGKVDVLAHDAFKGLTPREIGQRTAVLSDGKEVVLDKGNMDKYVDWDKGTFKPKKGVQKITRMKGSLSNVILDGAAPASPKIAQAAQQFKQAMGILGMEGEGSKVSTMTPSGKTIPFKRMGEDYWPREYTNGFHESLENNPKDFDRVVGEVAKSKGITPKEAADLLRNKKLYGELTDRAQHQRTFKQDSFVIDPKTVFDHINSFSSRVGMAKAFGPEDIRGSLVGDELTKLMNEGWDYKFASDTISRLVGREGKKDLPTPAESKIYSAVTDLNNARLMTSFIINNLANVTTTIARVGEMNTLKGLGAYLGNMEVARRMATLSGATEHTGTMERSGMSVAKAIGVPLSEKFMRTWADQSGRVTTEGLVDHLNSVKPSSPEFIRGKKLLDSLLGKDSGETIKRGFATPEELQRSGWQLAKDSQGVINPATMPPLGENIPNPMLRLGVNLAMQYKRMAMLGMNSLVESYKLNPARTIRTLLITAPIVGEAIGDAGSALFGGAAGTITGEGTVKGAIRDVKQRGESLSHALKPLLEDKLGVSKEHSQMMARYIDDMNRGFALGLIGDFLYSTAYWGGKAGADIVSGGISPAFEFAVDISKAIMNDAQDVISGVPPKRTGLGDIKQTISVLAPQRISAARNRSNAAQKGHGDGLLVHPPTLPKF